MTDQETPRPLPEIFADSDGTRWLRLQQRSGGTMTLMANRIYAVGSDKDDTTIYLWPPVPDGDTGFIVLVAHTEREVTEARQEAMRQTHEGDDQ